MALLSGCGTQPEPPPRPTAPPIRLLESADAHPRVFGGSTAFRLEAVPEALRLPPRFLRGGIDLAPNEKGVRHLAELPMFLPGDTSGRDSRASLLAPTGSVYRFHLEVPPAAELRTAAGYLIQEHNVGRTLRFRARVEPVPLRNGEPSEIAVVVDEATLARQQLFDVQIPVVEDGAWHPLTADLSPWSGQQVTLELRVDEVRVDEVRGDEPRVDEMASAEGEAPVWCGWAAPEIVETGTQQDGYDLLWLSLDTLRADRLGAYGYPRRPTSPNLDALAADGVVFETAVSQAPWTRPSHRAMFTGNYPSSNRGYATLPLALRLWREGWRTGALTGGGQVDARMGFHPGFGAYRVQYWHKDLEPVKAWYGANAGRRTFLFLHTFAVHDPYTDHRFARAEGLDPGRIGERFGRSEWVEWNFDLSAEEQAYVDALYDGGIAALDEVLGRLFRWLRASGRLDRTLVVITSDHGEQLFEHGNWRHGSEVYDHQLLVPAILHLPPALRQELGSEGEPSPSRIEQQIQLIDLYPTVLELLGLEIEHDVQGRSLLPLLRGEALGETLAARPAFSENVNIDAYERKSFRTRRWKVVRQTPKNERAASQEEVVHLFDLTRDPLEQHDIAAQHPDAVAEILERMKRLEAGAAELDDGVPDDLPPDLLERLRALGYVD